MRSFNCKNFVLLVGLISPLVIAQSDQRKLEIFKKVWEKCAVNNEAVSAKLISARVIRTTPVMKFGQPSGVSVVRIEIETKATWLIAPKKK
jgi:hypothetical protein